MMDIYYTLEGRRKKGLPFVGEWEEINPGTIFETLKLANKSLASIKKLASTTALKWDKFRLIKYTKSKW